MLINTKSIIILMSFSLIVVNTHPVRGLGKNYLRNIENTIINICNYKAYSETNNTNIYNCIKNKNNSCYTLENYTHYNSIRIECINKYKSDHTCGIVIALVMWVVIAICSNGNK
jgi:hypothetical protein